MPTLLLFDIDGTLVRGVSGTNKVHHDAFDLVLQETLGLPSATVREHNLEGKVDSQILLEVAEKHGLTREVVRPKLPSLFAKMVEHFKAFASPNDYEPLPGVTAVLPELKKAGYVLGLLTGNVEAIAHHKLGLIGLDQWFVTGSFGDMSEIRSQLVPMAVERANTLPGENSTQAITLADAIIIGDTPRDIDAALANKIHAIGVATGQYTSDELAEAGSSHTLNDLTNISDLMRALQKITEKERPT